MGRHLVHFCLNLRNRYLYRRISVIRSLIQPTQWVKASKGQVVVETGKTRKALATYRNSSQPKTLLQKCVNREIGRGLSRSLKQAKTLLLSPRDIIQ